MHDKRSESGHSEPYHPVLADVTYRQTLVEAFIKYVTSRPEEQGLAATTVLVKAEKKHHKLPGAVR